MAPRQTGPCNHCGTTVTPCWRRGPQEKPCLCNACGSRWMTKGTLEGYRAGLKRKSMSSVSGGNEEAEAQLPGFLKRDSPSRPAIVGVPGLLLGPSSNWAHQFLPSAQQLAAGSSIWQAPAPSKLWPDLHAAVAANSDNSGERAGLWAVSAAASDTGNNGHGGVFRAEDATRALPLHNDEVASPGGGMGDADEATAATLATLFQAVGAGNADVLQQARRCPSLIRIRRRKQARPVACAI